MNIIGIGTEIVECLRIGRLIEEHGEMFLHRAYTDREIRFCQARLRSTEHFAAVWAAKEAVRKAFNLSGRDLEWTDLEIRQEVGQRPEVYLGGAIGDVVQRLRITQVLLSLSHCRAYATANAIALG
jgi:holo-[acyl-carrier protein] synthase